MRRRVFACAIAVAAAGLVAPARSAVDPVVPAQPVARVQPVASPKAADRSAARPQAVHRSVLDGPAVELAARLEEWHAHHGQSWDPSMAMLASDWESPGLHSTLRDGTRVHRTRETLWYAQGLLERGQPADVERAALAIRAVLALQDKDPAHETYGTWPWLAEEPLSRMRPPDRNWADFLGASLAEMLVRHPDRLEDDLEAIMRASLSHAAAAIRQRDVPPEYTNIAIMGGVVTAVAGELLDDRSMLAFGRARLEACVEHAEYHGNFTEYNSPTYTLVALQEAERGLRLIRDEAARAAAERLHQIAWRTIAQSFHPATRQWAGPHSRATSDLLSDITLQALADRVGLGPVEVVEPGASAPVPVLPAPEEWRERFIRLPSDPLELRQPLLRDPEGHKLRESVTWISADATLGSVDRSDTWTQRHPLIAYWTAPVVPAVFRVRLLNDGRDFASGHLTIDQAGPHALLVLSTHQDRGDWHPDLDRPADGVFEIGDLRLRFELTHPDARVGPAKAGAHVLGAGSRHVTVTLGRGSAFAGSRVLVETGVADGRAWVDAVLYSGPPRDFRFREAIDVRLAAAIDLAGSLVEPVRLSTPGDGTLLAEWQSLAVTAPMNLP